MFLPPQFISAKTSVSVTLQLTSAYRKLVCNVCGMKIGGIELELWPFSTSFRFKIFFALVVVLGKLACDMVRKYEETHRGAK